MWFEVLLHAGNDECRCIGVWGVAAVDLTNKHAHGIAIFE
jgi:hypothetical protein